MQSFRIIVESGNENIIVNQNEMPSLELETIYSLVGDTYDKHLSDISSIMASLEKQDFIFLIESFFHRF